MKREIRYLVLPAAIVLMLVGCYSFTGGNLPPGIHSIGIPMVEDNSGYGQTDVRQNLTNLLIQKFTSDGSLSIADRTVSDAVLDVEIQPGAISENDVAVRAGEVVTTRRVTIRVQATFRDRKKQRTFWTRPFSESADYPSQASLTGLKSALGQAEDKLSDDILLAVISNW